MTGRQGSGCGGHLDHRPGSVRHRSGGICSEAGAEVTVGVAVIVDRGAGPKIEAAGLPYVAAYTAWSDLGLG